MLGILEGYAVQVVLLDPATPPELVKGVTLVKIAIQLAKCPLNLDSRAISRRISRPPRLPKTRSRRRKNTEGEEDTSANNLEG